MKLKTLFVGSISVFFAGCALTPRTADNVTLARTAKDYIGVASIDEMEISEIQKIPVEGSNQFGVSQYRFFVDTAHKKKYICDIRLWGLMADGKSLHPDEVKCDPR